MDTKKQRLIQKGHEMDRQARALFESGHPEKALALLRKWERICIKTDHKPGLLAALNCQGTVLRIMGKQADALPLFIRSEEIAREINDPNLGLALMNKGIALMDVLRRSEAERVFLEAEQFFRTKGDKVRVYQMMVLRTRVLIDLDRMDEASGFLDQLISFYRREADVPKLADMLELQGFNEEKRGHSENAIQALKEASDLQRSLGNARKVAQLAEQLHEIETGHSEVGFQAGSFKVRFVSGHGE